MSTNESMIVPIEKTSMAIDFFTGPTGPEAIIKAVKDKVQEFKPDMDGDTWKEEIRSFAYKITRTKTVIDNAGKELVAEYKEIPKQIDATRKRLREELDLIRDQVRRPLTEWEEAEKARIEGHKADIHAILRKSECGQDLDALNLTIKTVQEIEINDSWEEFQAEAQAAKDKVLTKLFTVREAVQKQEADRARLEKLRLEQEKKEQAEREARIAQEAADRARKEAEAKELRATLEKERAEREAAQTKADAQRLAQEAVEAERRRAEEEAKKAKAAEAQRVADAAHQFKIHGEILEDIANIVQDDDQARVLLDALRDNNIRHVVIDYYGF